jgi:hypothetical protein
MARTADGRNGKWKKRQMEEMANGRNGNWKKWQMEEMDKRERHALENQEGRKLGDSRAGMEPPRTQRSQRMQD